MFMQIDYAESLIKTILLWSMYIKLFFLQFTIGKSLNKDEHKL